MKKHTIIPLDKYINEDFDNPFDTKDIEVKPSHIADKGGVLKLRKEIFNINRVEYSKASTGGYCVLAKTPFAKGEIVEISPILFVGSDAKGVHKLKDYIFEIDNEQDIYGIVLGYGSLYNHSDTPNVTFAYNPKNKQMYFIAARMINAGEELNIDYGKEYWAERSGFGMIAPVTEPSTNNNVKSTDENYPQIDPLHGESGTFNSPLNKNNPGISGVAITTQQ